MRNIWNLRPAHIADQITKIELIHAKSSDFAAYETRAVDFGTYRTYPPSYPSYPPHEVPLNELKGHSGALVFGGGEDNASVLSVNSRHAHSSLIVDMYL